MACQITYLLARRLVGLVRLGPTPDEKDIEIAVLRHQLAVLRRQVARPRYAPADRDLALHTGASSQSGGLGSVPGHSGDAAALAPRARRPVLDLPPAWPAGSRRPGRRGRFPCPAPGPREPALGYPRIVGESAMLGVAVSATSVRNVRRRHRLRPEPRTSGLSWALFLRAQAAGTLACDLFHVDTGTWRSFWRTRPEPCGS